MYNIPNIDTKTGDVLRLSASGNEIETVSTEPRLVPSHSVGISVEGSIEWRKNRSKNKKAIESNQKKKKINCMQSEKCQLTALLCITINKR